MNNKTPEVGSDTTANNLCKRGCGFYGSGQFKDMCSKCYQEYIKNDAAAQSSMGSHNKNVRETYTLSPDLANRSSLLKDFDLLNSSSPPLRQSGKRKLESDVTTELPLPSSTDEAFPNSGCAQSSRQLPPASRTVNRCKMCRKRVGLTGFQCRCEGLFCALHRYSNQHDCSFDYRQQGKMEIARDNPEVRCAKIRKI